MECWSIGFSYNHYSIIPVHQPSTDDLEYPKDKQVEYTTLGRTGLKVSVAGLGCGGPSRLGVRDDARSESHAIALARQAKDLGINFLDTAQSSRTILRKVGLSHRQLRGAIGGLL